MAQGWLIAAAADIAAAHEISFGFDLDVLDPAAFAHPDQACETVAAADNIGVLLSTAAAQDADFVTTLQALATRLARAQLILVDDDARGAFPFLPATPAWIPWLVCLPDALATGTFLVLSRAGGAGEPVPEGAAS